MSGESVKAATETEAIALYKRIADDKRLAKMAMDIAERVERRARFNRARAAERAQHESPGLEHHG
jgi:hypothetical protein